MPQFRHQRKVRTSDSHDSGKTEQTNQPNLGDHTQLMIASISDPI